MSRCDNCLANKVCDHNRYGFENCGNYISTADVVPRAEVAREIFEEIETALNLYKCYGDSGIYYEHYLEADIAELKKKYTEGER